MTITDKIIPYYVWFGMGYGTISLFIAMINFGMLLVTLLTVRGIAIPGWMIAVVAATVMTACITVGWFLTKYDIQNRIAEYQNMNLNPQIRQIAEDARYIREKLE